MSSCAFCGQDLSAVPEAAFCPACGKTVNVAVSGQLIENNSKEGTSAAPVLADAEESKSSSEYRPIAPERTEDFIDTDFCGDERLYLRRLKEARLLIDHGFENLAKAKVPQDYSNACSDFRHAEEALLKARSELFTHLTPHDIIFWNQCREGKPSFPERPDSKPRLFQYIIFLSENRLITEGEHKQARRVQESGNSGSHYGEKSDHRRETVDPSVAKAAADAALSLYRTSGLKHLVRSIGADDAKRANIKASEQLLRFFADTSKIEDYIARIERKSSGREMTEEEKKNLYEAHERLNHYRTQYDHNAESLCRLGRGDIVEKVCAERHARLLDDICARLDKEVIYLGGKADFIDRKWRVADNKADFINRISLNANRQDDLERANAEFDDILQQLSSAQWQLREKLDPLYEDLFQLEESGDDRAAGFRESLDYLWNVATAEYTLPVEECVVDENHSEQQSLFGKIASGFSVAFNAVQALIGLFVIFASAYTVIWLIGLLTSCSK